MVNIHAAKTSLSKLIKLVEKGERITLARAGKPVAEIVPYIPSKPPPLSPDDAIFNIEKYTFKGPGGRLTNEDIDRILYGR